MPTQRSVVTTPMGRSKELYGRTGYGVFFGDGGDLKQLCESVEYEARDAADRASQQWRDTGS